MNCYYSNLIEGHDTHPVDIERAFKNDYSNDPRKRDLQLEAKAHIRVQQWIDAGGLAGRSLSLAGIKEIHHRFCELLPDDLLWTENPDTGELPRGDAAKIVGTGDRQARRIVSALVAKGVLTSESARAPLRLAFAVALASRWLPGLFPDRTE